MKYKIYDEIIEGDSPLELVTALRNGSRFANDESIEDYMKGFAERIDMMSGTKIPCENPEVFIKSLLEAQILIKL